MSPGQVVTSSRRGECRGVQLDPWTVYGEIAPGNPGMSIGVDVPDIGVLPPPGRYLGTLTGTSGSVPVRVTVVGQPEDKRGGRCRLRAESGREIVLSTGDTVAIRFEAVEAADCLCRAVPNSRPRRVSVPGMSTHITQGPPPVLSAETWTLLHDLRLRGFRTARAGPAEEEAIAAGLVVTRGANLALSQVGREAHAAWARLTPGSEEETLARNAYERFLALNVEFLRLCTDWQLKPGNEPNDHSDGAYDFKILERLDRLDERTGRLLDGLGEAVPRFGGYRPRLTEALERITDDRAWLASPRCDSYHTVWMQLHEDLLTTVGVNRADEKQPE